MGKLLTLVIPVAFIYVVAPTKEALFDRLLTALENVEDALEKRSKDVPKPVEDEQPSPVLTNGVEEPIEKRVWPPPGWKRCTKTSDSECCERSPCGVDEGDCDGDDQCKGHLKCGGNNCNWGGFDDCCYDDSQLRCKGQGGWNCCSRSNPCAEGDGVCGGDHECEGDLKCGNNNCRWGKMQDCCYKPNPDLPKECIGETGKRCNEGEGDCNFDFQCVGKLKCGSGNCAWGNGDDCCYETGDL